MTLDRSDLITVVGTLALIVGLALIHPALLLVAAGYVAIANSGRN